MRGVFTKIFREVWMATLLFALGLFLAEALMTMILPLIEEEINDVWQQLPFAKTLVTALLGSDFGDELPSQAFQSVAWVHPVVLTLIWAHEIMLCTRYPAGEVDRGTIDVLLGLPVSRRAVFLGETAVWLGSGVLILACAFVGHALGIRGMDPATRPDMGPTLLILVNLLSLYIAVGGIAFLVSSLSNRRGRAIGVVFSLVLASFMLNFLAGFWEPAQRLAFLGVINYYQPAGIMRDGALPLGDIAVLAGVGAAAWSIAGEIIARRSLCTV